ncbi:hypothetical protein Tco_0383137 [Tanacetum coccineum]
MEIDRFNRNITIADHLHAILVVTSDLDGGVYSNYSVSRPQLSASNGENRVLPINSQGEVQELTSQLMAVPISTREPKHNVNQPVATYHKKTVAPDSIVKKPRYTTRKLYEKVMCVYDQIAPILGYGDLVQGTITIKWVYYVEGLNHNLFSVGQFCNADLEVSFRKSTCHIRDLKGNDLLTCSRGIDLYSTSLFQDSPLQSNFEA